MGRVRAAWNALRIMSRKKLDAEQRQAQFRLSVLEALGRIEASLKRLEGR
jgi:hypothetical protein